MCTTFPEIEQTFLACRFCFPNTKHVRIPRRLDALSCSLKRLHASMERPNFERKCSPGNRHIILGAESTSEKGLLVDWTKTASEFAKWKSAHAKRAKLLFFMVKCRSSLIMVLPGPGSRKSRNFSGLFRMSQFPLYLNNTEVVSHQTSQSPWFFLH